MYEWFPNVIKSLNGIGPEFPICASLGSFKCNNFNIIRPIPKTIFGIHDLSHDTDDVYPPLTIDECVEEGWLVPVEKKDGTKSSDRKRKI